MSNRKTPQPPGVGVDAQGGAAIDPTANVLSLVEAANKRQDDLRAARVEFTAAVTRHAEQLANLREMHAKELREAEAARVNAIRQVDVLAVNTAADRASAAIQALAATTSSNAETLRAMVANTAATIATQTAQTVSAITDRLTALERTSYTGMGKQAVADPQMVELVAEMKSLTATRQSWAGKSEGINAVWLFLLGAVGLVGGLFGIAGVLYAAFKS